MKRFRILITGLVLLTSLQIFAQSLRRESYPNEHFRRLHYDLDDWISYVDAKYINWVATGQSYAYFATSGGGIFRYHLFENYWDYPFTTSNGLPGNVVRKVGYDEKDNVLWANTTEGDAVFDFTEQEWKPAQKSYGGNGFTRGNSTPNSTVGKNRFFGRESLQNLPGYFANGSYTLTGDWIILDDYFDEFRVSGYLNDYWERMWFPITGLGIGLGNSYSQRIDILPMGLAEVEPTVLQFMNDDIWIGGWPLDGAEHPGITRWRNSDGGWEYYESRREMNLPSDAVNDIEVSGHFIWFATDFGVSRLDTRKMRWKNFSMREGLYNDVVNDLHLFGDQMLVGTINGMNRIDVASGMVHRLKNEVVSLATIHQISHFADTIWVASNRGILKNVKWDENWQIIETRTAVMDLPVYAIEAGEKSVWAASGSGILHYDYTTKQWRSFAQIGREYDMPVKDIVIHPKAVWFSSALGLLKYNTQKYDWRLFTEQDGLLDNDCRRMLLDGDYLWVATRGGICQFYWNSPNRLD